MRRLLSLLALAAMLPLALGFLGALHGLGDSFAVFRFPAAGLACLAAVLLWRLGWRRTGGAGLGLALLAIVSTWAGLQQGAAGPFTLYQKNLSFRMGDAGPLIADILASNADFVTLQEVSARNEAIIAALAPTYPSHSLCPFAAVGGVAVLSRFPALSTRCEPGLGLAAMKLHLPAGDIWLVSIHLHWPFPYRQRSQLAQLLPVLAALDAPVVLAGDFNMVPWGHAVGMVETASGTARIGGLDGTLPRLDGWVALPIDHVLIPVGGKGGSTSRRGLLGSDHAGLVAHFALDPR